MNFNSIQQLLATCRTTYSKLWSNFFEEQPNMDTEPAPLKLGGVNISFPFQPYGIQKAMLGKIAVALTNKEHSLIESPTGTGKTLVLLCASLAWHRQSKLNKTPAISNKLKEEMHRKRLAKLESKPCTCGRRVTRTDLDELKESKDKLKDDCKESDCKRQKIEPMPTETSPYFKQRHEKPVSSEPEFISLSDSDDEIHLAKKQADRKKSVDINKLDDDDVIEILDETDQPKKPLANCEAENKKTTCAATNGVPGSPCKNCEALEIEKEFANQMGDYVKAKVGKIPRIYYGTRTHKQITQVIRELKKTCYTRDLKMSILSSRDRTCINDDVKDEPDRNDRCQELIKNSKNRNDPKVRSKKDSCSYYRDSNAMVADFEQIHNTYKDEAWDIEDAVRFSRDNCLCPYYGMRSIQDQADITFCPYNYLLDPNIRNALNVNLNNAIIIFDEAHNIEDICRDSASYIIDTMQIDDALHTIMQVGQNYMQGSAPKDAYDFFRNLLTDVKALLLRHDNWESVNDPNCEGRHIMSHDGMMNFLEQSVLGPNRLQEIKEHLRILRGDDEESGKSRSQDDSQEGGLNNQQLQLITQLKNTLDFMYANQKKYSTDFKCIISKHIDRQKPNFRAGNRPSNGTTNSEFRRLSLLCLNPGIAFEKIHSLAWSVIVASGTLSPIESLKTELGCTFNQIFEGSHVIGQDRIFARILARGPNNVDLNCSYNSSLRLEFQDEVGMVVRDVCKTVPNGVLVFFPSYDRMENLSSRWHTKGYMKDILRAGKKFYKEQRNQTASKFEEELAKYHQSAKGRGALLFAVFRGKVSEGIDFSDAAARAVITIGIPYPNVKEVTIGLKKDYNDRARAERPHLMPGHAWYAAQAFRALNQALGRCIRHKDDWGAIIMIDSRLSEYSSQLNISKWIRKVAAVTRDYSSDRADLERFVHQRSAESLSIQPKIEENSLGANTFFIDEDSITM